MMRVSYCTTFLVRLLVCPAFAGSCWALAVNPNPVPDCTITTETIASVPADRTRRTIGVCEDVQLTANASATWSVIRGPGAIVIGGTLDTTTGTSVVFSAADHTTVARVVARLANGATCFVDLTIIRPNGIVFSNPDPALFHLAKTSGGGFRAQTLTILPATVSFYGIVHREAGNGDTIDGTTVSVLTTTTGVMAQNLANVNQPHPPGIEVTINESNVIQATDLVFATAPQGIVGAGLFRWSIPQLFRCANLTAFHEYTTLFQIIQSDNLGLTLASKGGLEVFIPLDTPERRP